MLPTVTPYKSYLCLSKSLLAQCITIALTAFCTTAAQTHKHSHGAKRPMWRPSQPGQHPKHMRCLVLGLSDSTSHNAIHMCTHLHALIGSLSPTLAANAAVVHCTGALHCSTAVPTSSMQLARASSAAMLNIS
jgi:hypothetical protein